MHFVDTVWSLFCTDSKCVRDFVSEVLPGIWQTGAKWTHCHYRVLEDRGPGYEEIRIF